MEQHSRSKVRRRRGFAGLVHGDDKFFSEGHPYVIAFLHLVEVHRGFVDFVGFLLSVIKGERYLAFLQLILSTTARS